MDKRHKIALIVADQTVAGKSVRRRLVREIDRQVQRLRQAINLPHDEGSNHATIESESRNDAEPRRDSSQPVPSIPAPFKCIF